MKGITRLPRMTPIMTLKKKAYRSFNPDGLFSNSNADCRFYFYVGKERMRLLGLILFMCLPAMAGAQDRVAFVVGNSVYDYAPPLPNPANDANLIARTLEDLDFEVAVHTDLTRWEIASELVEFLKNTEDAETTLFYFAGHGMQHEGQNYLLGTDAQLRTELDIESEALKLDQITRLLRRGSRAALVFVDACRDNPLATAFYQNNFSTTRALTNKGLAAPSVSYEGAMLAFAASPGQVAYDGTDANSPFTKALAKHLPAANTEILTLMKRVIRDVRRETKDQQIPMISNDLSREIYLNVEENDSGAAVVLAQERAMFEAAMSLNTERSWRIFLDRFPNGSLYGDALTAIDELSATRLAALSGTSTDVGQPISISRQVAESAETDLGLGRNDARLIQRSLNDLGYDAGPNDGVLGKRSRKAIADFQAAVGLPSTGVVTYGTADALNIEISAVENDVLPIYSSRNARRYDHNQLAMIESDPRLIEAARLLTGQEYVYGFYDGRLYIGLLRWCCDTWQKANETAKKLGGHLVTIANDAENKFVYDLTASDERFWEDHGDWITGPTIGLYQKPGSREPDGGWVWVTGEPNNYINWQPPFPNNNEGTASIGGFGHNPPGTQYFKGPQEFGHWDDYNSVARGYIIEIQ